MKQSAGWYFLYALLAAIAITALLFVPGYFIAAFLVASFLLTQPEERKPNWICSVNAHFQRLDDMLNNYLLEKLRSRDGLLIVNKDRCPYCRTALADDSQLVRCNACETLHHQECWTRNGHKCSIFGCDSNQPRKMIQ